MNDSERQRIVLETLDNINRAVGQDANAIPDPANAERSYVLLVAKILDLI